LKLVIVMSDSNSVIIFINKDAINVNELFLNEDWSLTELFDRIYTITVRGRKLDWLIKIHPENKYAQREITYLNTLKKVCGVPKILAVGLSPKLNYIILSKASGVDLYEYVRKNGRMTEAEIRNIARKLLTILHQIHRKGVIHKDIKPENVIYDSHTKNVTLIDFEGKQTDDYCSPEQVTGNPVTEKTDIWGTGILCYYLARHDTPYHNSRQILHGKLVFSTKWSEQFVDFLSCLLEREVKFRYSTKDALNHVWLS